MIAVDRAATHFFPPSLLWLMVGKREPADFTRSLGRLAERGVELRCAGMCFIETGNARAGIGKGNFYAEPTPQVKMHGPNLFWHAAKVLYEKYWLYRRF